MKLTGRKLFPLLLALIMLVSGCSIGGCGNDKKTATPTGPVIGIVNMEQAVKANPAYSQYKLLLDEYNNLESQYKAEQQSLTVKSQVQAIALKGLGTDGNSQEMVDSLNTELKAKLAVKEQELNAEFQAKRIELINKYRNTVKVTPSEADLRIVNLQLELQSNLNLVAMPPELKAKADAERAAKEEELKALLAERGPVIEGSNKELEDKVNAELKPFFDATQKELNEYALNLQQELTKERDLNVQNRAHEIMAENGLPNPVEWNNSWQTKLGLKDDEVKALHDAILEDIRTRVEVVAREKQVELVVADYVGNINALDLTNDIIASYGNK